MVWTSTVQSRPFPMDLCSLVCLVKCFSGENLYGNVMFFLWKSEKSIWNNCELVWKSEEFIWNNNEFVWKHEIIYMGNMKNMEQWRSCMDMWRIYKENETHIWKKWWIWLKKWRNLYGKNMEKWRICMERWSIYKESEEFLRKKTTSSGKVKEFIWSNGILSIFFWRQLYSKGCPGKPKFKFHILCR